MSGEYNALKIMKNTLPLLTLCVFIGVSSGLILDTYSNMLYALPGLTILVPVVIGMGGNLGAILGARISSALHLGIIDLSPADPLLGNNLLATSIVGVLSFFITGVLGHLFCVLIGFGSIGFVKMVLISTLSGVILTLIVAITAVLSAFISYRHGLDPDDTTIPVVTSICDVFGVLALFGVAMVVL